MSNLLKAIASIITTLAAVLAVVAFAIDHSAQWQAIVHYAVLSGEIALALLVVAGLVGFFASQPDIFFFVLRWLFRAVVVAGFVAGILYLVEPHIPLSSRKNLEVIFAVATVGGVALGWLTSSLVLGLFNRGTVAGRY